MSGSRRNKPLKPILPPVWDKDPYPRIDPGNYLVRVTGWKGPEWMRLGQRYSLILDCAVVSEGVSLCIFFNFGGKPGAIGLPGRQSKYHLHWVMATGAEPRKGEVMHWDVFVDKWFMAEVEDAIRDKDGKTKPEAAIYSRISRFIRREEM